MLGRSLLVWQEQVALTQLGRWAEFHAFRRSWTSSSLLNDKGSSSCLVSFYDGEVVVELEFASLAFTE